MTKFALKNPVSVIVLAVLLFITGLISFSGMRRESFPEIKIPYIFVTTLYRAPTLRKLKTSSPRKLKTSSTASTASSR